MTVRAPDTYFQSVQYNWTGQVDDEGKKIPGETQECIVRGVYHPSDKGAVHIDPFSIIDFEVKPGKEFNPIRFATVQNIAYITTGSGIFKIFDEMGSKVIEEHRVERAYSIKIPPKTTYSFTNLSTETSLMGVMVSNPAWFKEDETYDWELVK